MSKEFLAIIIMSSSFKYTVEWVGARTSTSSCPRQDLYVVLSPGWCIWTSTTRQTPVLGPLQHRAARLRGTGPQARRPATDCGVEGAGRVRLSAASHFSTDSRRPSKCHHIIISTPTPQKRRRRRRHRRQRQKTPQATATGTTGNDLIPTCPDAAGPQLPKSLGRMTVGH